MATLPEADRAVSEESFKHWLLWAVTTVDAYSPALMKVAFGHASPAHVLEQAEAGVQAYIEKLRRKST